MRVFFGLLLGSIILLTSYSASAADGKWPPRRSLMLTRNVACFSNASGSYVKVRTKIAPGEFTIVKRKATGLKRLIGSIRRNKRKLKNKAFADSRPVLRKTIKQLKRQASQLTDCAQRLGQAIGCSVEISAPQSLAVLPGNINTQAITISSSCSGSLNMSVIEPSEKGVFSAALDSISYQATLSDGLGLDGVVVRACSMSSLGVVEGCSQNFPIGINRCSLSAAPVAATVLENRSNMVGLSGESTCGSDIRFEIVSGAQHGEVIINEQGFATYTPGYFAGEDQFFFRACDSQGAGCGEPVRAVLQVEAGASFQGNESSLSSYREHISMEERRHLVRKIASNRFDLLDGAGATMPLSELLTRRFLDEDFIAPDLQTALETIRDRGLNYGRPIHTEEFIPNWRDDFTGPNSNCADSGVLDDPECWQPIIPVSFDLGSNENVHYGMERLMMSSDRSWHTTNFRYHWGTSRMSAQYLKRARYLSPVHTRLTHFWMGHFGTATEILNGFEENLVGYYVKTLEREALGNFRDMMLGEPGVANSNGCAPLTPWQKDHGSIICDAASNIWLSNDLNLGNNQNFARELMELYMTSPRDEVMNIDNYTDPFDIVSAARFVSGLRVQQSKSVGGSSVFAPRFDPSRHSYFPSSMFLNLEEVDPELPVYDQSFEPGDLVRHLLDYHPGVPRFIAAKLFGTFVYPDPSEALVAELGEALKALDYDLYRFMKLILNSEAMFSQRAAGKNCLSSPLETYSRILNSVEMPMIVFRDSHGASNVYANIHTRLQNAGETPLGYSSVFTHDYCGRSPGIDGSTSWLQSHLMIFRVISFTRMLNEFTWAIRNDYDLSSGVEVIRRRLGVDVLAPQDMLRFFEDAFSLSLSQEERDIFMEYLTHRQNGSGQISSVVWNDGDAALMREKIVGLMVILSGFQGGTTH